MNQLNELHYSTEELSERLKIEKVKEVLLLHFPQSNTTVQIKGKIENILIEMNHKFSDRIVLPEESFKILLNAYTAHQTSIEMGDVQQMQDVIQLSYPNSQFYYEVMKTDAISEEEFLVLIEFESL